jgi:hypothetical protein
VVVDYKTGQIGSDTGKLRRYEMQLYCYKLLVEKSRTFAGYTVEQGKLIFLEPTPGGETKPHERLITFKQNDVTHLESLLGAMWQCVMQLDMPDISGYGDSVGEAKRFESDLIARLENS